MKNKSKASSKTMQVIGVIVLLLLIGGGIYGIHLYNVFMAPNVSGSQEYLYVPTNSGIDDLYREIASKNLLKDAESFQEAAVKMKLAQSLKPGRYRLAKSLNNRTLINKLKSGNQDPVKLKIQNIRKKENFITYLAKNLEADSLAFATVLDSLPLLEKYGFTADNSYVMYIPNTYEVYWNMKPLDFFEKMEGEYEKFWTDARKQKAEALKLSPEQVIILASIVDAEALYDKEMPVIAGLYLNRLNRGILLQADPTVIFANNDFTVKRVTNALLSVNSKYNTYKYKGLPPGPIMMPSIQAIDAVLNRQENNYIYMCAKEDFSGYHNFAATVEEHNRNAQKYREALNKRNIFR